MTYNSFFKMRDLFQNPKLESVIPQIDNKNLNRKPNAAFINKVVKKYLENALGGEFSGSKMTVVGKKREVLKEVQSLKWVLEGLFNNFETLQRNIKSNTPVYTPFRRVEDIAGLNSFKQKYQVLAIILDNINYNPDFGSENSVRVFNSNKTFWQRQQLWLKKVRYKGANHEKD